MSKETSSCKYRIFLLCQVTYNVQWEDGIYSTYFFGGERECGGVCISFSVSLDHKRVYTDVCHPISFLVFSLFQVALRHLLFLWVLSGIWLPSFHQWQTWGHGNLCRAIKGPISPDMTLLSLPQCSSQQDGCGVPLSQVSQYPHTYCFLLISLLPEEETPLS